MTRRTRLRLASIVLAMVMWPMSGGLAIEVGQQLFEGLASPVTATIAGSAQPVPAERLPCMGCHGRDGMGVTEGSVAAPAITPEILASARLTRPGYDEAAFLRALKDGVGAGGRSLDAIMPRYGVTASEAASVRAHLSQVAIRERTGVQPDRIVFAIADEGQGSKVIAEGLNEAWRARGAPQVWGRVVSFDIMSTRDAAQKGFALVFPAGSRISHAGESGPMPDMPVLFPIRGAIRNPLSRGLQADEAEQIRRLIGEAGASAEIRADAVGRQFLIAERLAPADRIHPIDNGEKLAGKVVVVAESAALNGLARQVAQGVEVHLPFEDALRLAGTLAKAGAATVTADPRPSTLDNRGADRRRMMSVAAFLIEEALARAGLDLTRTRFLRSFGTLKLADPAWPALDYQRFPVSGTRALVIRRDIDKLLSIR